MSEDLIKRSDAIKALRKLGHEVVVIDKVCSLGIAAEFIDVIRDIPSADRPQGKWFKDNEGTFICSACGSGYKDQPTIMGKPMFEWCPICGCRMKGADDE